MTLDRLSIVLSKRQRINSAAYTGFTSQSLFVDRNVLGLKVHDNYKMFGVHSLGR